MSNKKVVAPGIVYLAGPYTHADASVRQHRYELITGLAAKLISQGMIVFSPLTMTHPIDRLLSLDDQTLGSDYWVKFDESFMEFCSSLAVFTIEGWDQSSGIAREISYFTKRGRPVFYLHPAAPLDFHIVKPEKTTKVQSTALWE